jgi:hypothetical protein
MPKGAATTGTRAYFKRSADHVPVLLLREHDHEEQVRTHAEVLAFVRDQDALEVLLGLGRGLVEQSDDVGVDAVHLRLHRHAQDAVAEIPRLRAVVLEHGRVAALEDVEGRVGRIQLARDVLALLQAVDGAIFAVEARRAAVDHALDRGRQLEPAALDALRDLLETKRVPGLERTARLIVAPLHRFIDLVDVVADLADQVRRVSERAREHLPGEAARGAFIRQ